MPILRPTQLNRSLYFRFTWSEALALLSAFLVLSSITGLLVAGEGDQGCQAADEVRALIAVFILLLALVPAGSKNQKKTHVWMTPCKAHDGSRGRSRGGETDHDGLEVVGRNNRPSPKPLRRLRLQTTVTNSHFHGVLNTLAADLCNGVLTNKETQEPGGFQSFRWLPDNPTHWYKKKVKCLDKKNKVKQILPKFHEGLQRYLASIEKLRDPHWSKLLEADCRYQREKRLEEISGKLAQLLCELDKCMRDMGIGRGPGLGAREGKLLFRSQLDLTYAQLVEAVILSRYGEYIKDWNRIVRQVVGKKGSSHCSSGSSHNNSVLLR